MRHRDELTHVERPQSAIVDMSEQQQLEAVLIIGDLIEIVQAGSYPVGWFLTIQNVTREANELVGAVTHFPGEEEDDAEHLRG